VNRAAAQTRIMDRGYTPSQIYVAPVERVGAGLFAANVRFNGHPGDARRSGHYHVGPPNRCWRSSPSPGGARWLRPTKAAMRLGDTGPAPCSINGST